MKPKMMSKDAMEYLFHHILGGFKTSHEGIVNLEKGGLADDQQVAELIRKNSERLIERIKEFRIAEKVFGLFFACLFTWMQVTGEDLEMRKTGRRIRGRRRHDTEQTE